MTAELMLNEENTEKTVVALTTEKLE